MATEVTAQVRQNTSQAIEGPRRRMAAGVSPVRQDLPVDMQTVPPATEARQTADGQSNPPQLGQIVDQLNNYVQHVRRELHFSVDESTGETIVRVIDSESEEVIRQIPPEEVVEMQRFLAEDRKAGVLLRTSI